MMSARRRGGRGRRRPGGRAPPPRPDGCEDEGGPAMETAVIVDAVRTPVGRRNGKLSSYHPVDLAALALEAIVERNGLDPELVDDVIMGCVSQVGDQSANIA